LPRFGFRLSCNCVAITVKARDADGIAPVEVSSAITIAAVLLQAD
jgi:hypothetical protein